MTRAKTRQEIAAEFGISRKTFYRWLRGHNIKLSRGSVTVREQEIIYRAFGKPKGDTPKN